MYPFLLKPPIKDYIWGGKRLKEEFSYKTDKEKTAEAWVLSCHKDGESVIENGEYKEKLLSEVVKQNPELMGKKAEKFEYFPILIKLIDACDRLSVQVHPDDEYMKKNGGGYGKTEMWYVVDAEENAEILYGLSRDVSKEEFESRIKDGTLFEVCNFVPAKKGDVFFISSGTLHAIGKGVLIAEIQQNSNTTYRVFDYNRVGADGKPRELHIKNAVDVTKTEKIKTPYGAVGKTEEFPFGKIRNLSSCDLFNVDLLSLSGDFEYENEESFVSLLVLSGNIILSYPDGKIPLKKGDSVFVPAKLLFTLSGNGEIIKTEI